MVMNWAYIAGYFDGEGTLVKLIQNKNYTRHSIHITNTDYQSLYLMQEFAGIGKIYNADRKNGKPHWKKAWMWSILNHRDILKFIQNVKPFCIVKKDKIFDAEEYILNHNWRLLRKENHKLKSILEEEVKLDRTKSLRQLEIITNTNRSSIRLYMKEFGFYDEWKRKRFWDERAMVMLNKSNYLAKN